MQLLRIWAVLCLSGLCLQAQARAGSYLGLGLAPLPDRPGVIVKSVDPTGPAAKAGLQVGDIVISFNDGDIRNGRDLYEVVGATPVGSKARVQFSRAGKTHLVTCITAPRPLVNEIVAIPTMPPEIPEPLIVWKSLFLGLEVEDVEGQLADFFGVEHGAFIRFVDKGSVASMGGLRAGDVVVACGGRAISGARELTAVVQMESREKTTVHLNVVRERKHLDIALRFTD